MTVCRVAALLAAMLLLAGCSHQEYHVLLTPQGDGVERRLEWSTSGSGIRQGDAPADKPAPPHDDAIEKRLSALYGNAGTVENDQRVYVGRFSGKLPSDVGGAGTYRVFRSDLGTLGIYSERFRGDDDLTRQVTTVQRSADKVTDLLIGWFTHEMGDVVRFPQLRAFMDGQLRQDLKNLGLLTWRRRVLAADDATNTETLALAAQYLQERGYFGVDELPLIVRTAARGNASLAMPLVQRMIARRMGVTDTEPIPSSLGFLTDSQLAAASLADYLRTTPDYQQAVVAWEKRKAEVGEQKAGASPDPISVLEEPSTAMVSVRLGIFDGSDQARVELACPVAPFATNGQWDAKSRRVTWPLASLGDKGEPVVYRFALWADPAEDTQKAHLGQVALRNEKLAGYVLWRNGLNEADAKEWSSFLAALKPAANLDAMKDQIKRFHFTTTQPSTAPSPQADLGNEDAIVTLFLDALVPETAQPKP